MTNYILLSPSSFLQDKVIVYKIKILLGIIYLMGVIKTLAKSLSIALLILILTSPVWIKTIPTKNISFLIGRSSVIDNLLCHFSNKVSGKALDSLVTSGSLITMNRCFKPEDLVVGTLIIFHDNSAPRFGIIRHLIPLDPIVYKVSDEKAPELLHDVVKEEIIGITNNIDISQSKYQAKNRVESFILDSTEFLKDLYLAKIPRSMGLEMATVGKTNNFNNQQDKFCIVIFPRKKLTGVNSEIINQQTKSIISLGKDIVFDTAPSPNINCSEFGSGQGMLNLSPGNYQYRFLVNHQVLFTIPFEIQ